jgi:hypothetical protein
MKCENKYTEVRSLQGKKKLLQIVVNLSGKWFIYDVVHICNNEQKNKQSVVPLSTSIVWASSVRNVNGQQKSNEGSL